MLIDWRRQRRLHAGVPAAVCLYGQLLCPHHARIAAPRVGLLSNGTEEHKGAELQHETFPLLKAADAAGRIRFIGNVEASQVFNGDVDVVVTDGFTGNVLLKGIEGSIKYMTRQLKGIFMKNFKTKMAALAIKDEFKALKASLDPNEVGGTAMLGISKPVIKAHGSSDARAIYNAIRQAISFVDSGIIDDITADISYMRVDKHAGKGAGLWRALEGSSGLYIPRQVAAGECAHAQLLRQ